MTLLVFTKISCNAISVHNMQKPYHIENKSQYNISC
jgi:hypothetical protein